MPKEREQKKASNSLSLQLACSVMGQSNPLQKPGYCSCLQHLDQQRKVYLKYNLRKLKTLTYRSKWNTKSRLRLNYHFIKGKGVISGVNLCQLVNLDMVVLKSVQLFDISPCMLHFLIHTALAQKQAPCLFIVIKPLISYHQPYNL